MTTSVTVYCGGSVDMVKGFNLDVITHGRLGLLAAPVGLTVNPGTLPGEVEAKWTKGVAIHGFVVQHATDPTNAATISASIPSTKPKFTLSGMPQGREREHARRGHRSRVGHGAEPVERVGHRQRALTARGEGEARVPFEHPRRHER